MKRFTGIAGLALSIVMGAGLWLAASFAILGGTAFAQDAEEIDTSGIVEMTLGSEDAPVTLIEYASFTCPHCASFHKDQFKKLKADYIDTGKVKFIYRDVYFDKFGLWAAMVARCGGPERFFGISDMIYEDQRGWIGDGKDQGVADRLRKFGKLAGLSEDALDACFADREKAQALVAVFQQNSKQDGVDSTPTIIVDGTKYQNMSYSEIKAVIDDRLDE